MQALLIPDLLGYWLTGQRVTEDTNASTTGLLDARTGQWSTELIDTLGLPTGLLPRVVPPGTVVGDLTPAVAAQLGLDRPLTVTTVGSHDTASAIVGVPAENPNFAYISCGTWGLVGVELDQPVLTEESRAANFTNERGVDGTIRYLRNVMGLWLLSESIRTWELQGRPAEPDRAARAAARLPAGRPAVRPGRPGVPATRRHAVPDRAAACRRPGNALRDSPAGDRPLHPGQPGRHLRGAGSPTRSGCPADRSTSSTSSAAVRRTSCSAN